MYTPKNTSMAAHVVTEFIKSHAFGILISNDLSATHLPLSL